MRMAIAKRTARFLYAAAFALSTLPGCAGTSGEIPDAHTYARPRPISIGTPFSFPGNLSSGGNTPSGGTQADTRPSGSTSSGGTSSSSSSSSSGGTITEDRDAPAIANVAVTPNTMRFTGGVVTVTANVSDNVGLERVWVEVTKPDGSTAEFALALQSRPIYSGTWRVPLHETGGEPLSYTFRVLARDLAGNSAAAIPVTLTVYLPSAPLAFRLCEVALTLFHRNSDAFQKAPQASGVTSRRRRLRMCKKLKTIEQAVNV